MSLEQLRSMLPNMHMLNPSQLSVLLKDLFEVYDAHMKEHVKFEVGDIVYVSSDYKGRFFKAGEKVKVLEIYWNAGRWRYTVCHPDNTVGIPTRSIKFSICASEVESK